MDDVDHDLGAPPCPRLQQFGNICIYVAVAGAVTNSKNQDSICFTFLRNGALALHLFIFLLQNAGVRLDTFPN